MYYDWNRRKLLADSGSFHEKLRVAALNERDFIRRNSGGMITTARCDVKVHAENSPLVILPALERVEGMLLLPNVISCEAPRLRYVRDGVLAPRLVYFNTPRANFLLQKSFDENTNKPIVDPIVEDWDALIADHVRNVSLGFNINKEHHASE